MSRHPAKRKFVKKPRGPMKVCVACKAYHPLHFFAPSVMTTRDGLQYNCRESVAKRGGPTYQRMPNGRLEELTP